MNVSYSNGGQQMEQVFEVKPRPATTQESAQPLGCPHFRLMDVKTPFTYTVSVVQFLVLNGHSEISSSSAVAKLYLGLKQGSSMVIRLDIKSEAQMGQLIRVLGRGKLLGLRYFFTNWRRCVFLDCCWVSAIKDERKTIEITKTIQRDRRLREALDFADIVSVF